MPWLNSHLTVTKRFLTRFAVHDSKAYYSFTKERNSFSRQNVTYGPSIPFSKLASSFNDIKKKNEISILLFCKTSFSADVDVLLFLLKKELWWEERGKKSFKNEMVMTQKSQILLQSIFYPSILRHTSNVKTSFCRLYLSNIMF